MRKTLGIIPILALMLASIAPLGMPAASAAEHLRLTPRLNLVVRVVEGRAWAPLVMDGAICLPDFARAHLEGWLSPAEAAALPRQVALHAPTVSRLRQLLAACPDRAQRVALDRLRLDSIFGLDVRPDGLTVLFTH